LDVLNKYLFPPHIIEKFEYIFTLGRRSLQNVNVFYWSPNRWNQDFFICPFVTAKGPKPFAQTMAHALFENTRNPGKKVNSTAYESKRPLGRFCRISMCFQIHRLCGTAFGRARALR
jgi:hypothetical protein